jgi:hypothetical protein
VEVAPFGGYRFGDDFFELITDRAVGLDGPVSFGAAVDVPLQGSHGFQIEGLFTLSTPTSSSSPRSTAR